MLLFLPYIYIYIPIYFPELNDVKSEIESDEREIFIYKKKNGIPVTTALKMPDVIRA